MRKQEILEALKFASRESKIITLSDKLANMRAIARDYQLIGNMLWERFNQKDVKYQAWYYQSLREALVELDDYDAWKEYDEIVVTLFKSNKKRSNINMLNKNVYEILGKEYGKVSSWSIWAEVGEKPTSKTGDMSVFLDKDIYKKLNTDVVFVGLNASIHEDRKDGYTGNWSSFHSDDNEVQNDFKLRYALVNTPFEGQYITDVIKNHPDKNSDTVLKHIKNHPETLTKNIEVLRKELKILGGNPVLIALGDAAYELLKGSLGDETTILKMTHYSYVPKNKESLRVEALDILLNEESLKGLAAGVENDLKSARDKEIKILENKKKSKMPI